NARVTTMPTNPRPDPPAPVEGRSTQDSAGSSPVRAGSRVVIIGGGPGGYEAALVAAQLGANVHLVERQGLGGSAVLTDVVPSKTLIATAEWMTATDYATELGVRGRSEEHTSELQSRFD